MAKPELRAAARALRAQGLTYEEIVERLGVAKSSVSLWVRDIPHVPDPERTRRVQAHVRMMAEARWSGYRAERDARRAQARAAAADSVTSLSREELLRLGALIYWCEGTKSKPWRENAAEVVFINSDPMLIDLFLRFLAAAGVAEERVCFRVSIHETADAEAAVRWWADWVGVPPSSFLRTTMKRHNPKTVRKNTGEAYRGCLVIRVRRARELYWMIEGLVTGVHRAAMADVRSRSGRAAAEME